MTPLQEILADALENLAAAPSEAKDQIATDFAELMLVPSGNLGSADGPGTEALRLRVLGTLDRVGLPHLKIPFNSWIFSDVGTMVRLGRPSQDVPSGPDWDDLRDEFDLEDILDSDLDGEVREITAGTLEARRAEAKTIDLGPLLDEIEAVWRRHVVFTTDHEAVLLALWTAHTYVYRKMDFTPYVRLTSAEPACGKTRVLEVAKAMASRAEMSANISAAILYRLIEARHPTMLVDETDTIYGKTVTEQGDALRSVLNSGYSSSGRAHRMGKEGGQQVFEEFSTFSPKMLAGLNPLPDAVETRCIPIRLRRRLESEIIEKWRSTKKWKELAPLRDQLRRWSYIEMPVEAALPEGLSDRQEDIIEPLMALAEMAGQDWVDRTTEAVTYIFTKSGEVVESRGTRLLRDIRIVWGESPKLFTADLVLKLRSSDNLDWSDEKFGITDRSLARDLKRYGILSKNIRVGERQAKGYELADFIDAWERYTL